VAPAAAVPPNGPPDPVLSGSTPTPSMAVGLRCARWCRLTCLDLCAICSADPMVDGVGLGGLAEAESGDAAVSKPTTCPCAR